MEATFGDLVRVIRNIGGDAMTLPVRGSLSLTSAQLVESLRKCVADVEATDLSVTGKPIEQLRVGDTVSVEIRSPRLTFGRLVETLDDLITTPAAHIREPSEYFIAKLDYYNRDSGESPDIVGRYRDVIALVATLRKSAAFMEESEETLVFIKAGKFDVPVRYTQQDLLSLDRAAVRSLAAIALDDAHVKERTKILTEAVTTAAAKYPENERFGRLLAEASSVKQHYERGFELYASGFSYEKLKSEVEAARIEFTGKIHKTLSDIQNQLLGVPVATVIVATQMKPNTSMGAEFWISLAILLGSIVFAVLMHFLLRNQRHTLAVVGHEIERQERHLQKAPQDIATQLQSTFALLKERQTAQGRVLYTIDVIVWVGVLLACLAFYKLSTPVQTFFGSLLV